MTRRLRNERGQSIVISVIALVSLLGIAGLVLDAGSWFRSRRASQQTSDAAALAGAQVIWNQSSARSQAVTYADKNGGGVASADVAFSTTMRSGDTIGVTAHRNPAGFFTKLFGVGSVAVASTSKVLAAPMQSATGVAPFAVDHDHPYLKQSGGCPCYNLPTQLDLDLMGPGAFKVLDVDGSSGGIGQSILAGWILNGYPGALPLGWYYNDPGAKFNPAQIQNALTQRIGDTLLFPVYDNYKLQGANFQWKIVGFVGFTITGFNTRGSSGILYGSFTHTIWQGLQNDDPSAPDWGAYALALIQ